VKKLKLSYLKKVAKCDTGMYEPELQEAAREIIVLRGLVRKLREECRSLKKSPLGTP
jgi:hypothetical protein